MKKIFYFISAAVIALGLASCTKETASTEEYTESKAQMTIVANINDCLQTKADLSGDDTKGYKVVWSNGDQIKFNVKKDGGQKTVVYTISEGAGTTSGVFTGPALPDGEYMAGYGDNLSMLNGGILNIDQTYSSTKSACCAPMMAKVTVTEGVATIENFKNICGLLRLDLKGNGTVKEIKITTDQDQGGLIELDADGAARVRAYPAPKEVTLSCGENGVALTSESKPFYISMPKNSYTGVKIEVTDMEGNTCTKTLKAGKSLDIARAQITPVSLTAVLEPISGTAKNDCNQDVPWVQLNDFGTKWATFNIDASSEHETGGYYIWNNEFDISAYKWGANWHTPIFEDIHNLIQYCDYSWDEDNKTATFTGRGIYSGNSIKLKAAGYELDGSICEEGQGYYMFNEGYGFCYKFGKDGCEVFNVIAEKALMPLRAVLN